MKLEYPVRLQVYMAKSGCGSRRYCETLIAAGRVKVNMKRVVEPGTKVEKDDVVMLDDVLVEPVERTYYYALNKPMGYVCTNYDPNEKLYARDLIDSPDRDLLFSIGRLDKNSTGLLLLTNDGEAAQRIMHPSHQIEKEYMVKCDEPVLRGDLEEALRGVYVDSNVPYRIKRFEMLTKRWIRIILTEGRNREIRKIFSYFGYEIKQLVRVRIGTIELGDMQPGRYRMLTPSEIQELLASGGKDSGRRTRSRR